MRVSVTIPQYALTRVQHIWNYEEDSSGKVTQHLKLVGTGKCYIAVIVLCTIFKEDLSRDIIFRPGVGGDISYAPRAETTP